MVPLNEVSGSLLGPTGTSALPGNLSLRIKFGSHHSPARVSALQSSVLMVLASFYQLAAWDLSSQGITGLWVKVAGLPLSTCLWPLGTPSSPQCWIPHSSNGGDDGACLTELLL